MNLIRYIGISEIGGQFYQGMNADSIQELKNMYKEYMPDREYEIHKVETTSTMSKVECH